MNLAVLRVLTFLSLPDNLNIIQLLTGWYNRLPTPSSLMPEDNLYVKDLSGKITTGADKSNSSQFYIVRTQPFSTPLHWTWD